MENASEQGQGLPVGTYVQVVGLKMRPQLNGRHAVILEPLQFIDVPENDGVHRACHRYGVQMVTMPDVTGWLRPENLVPISEGWDSAAVYRAIWLNETGMEPPETRALVPEVTE